MNCDCDKDIDKDIESFILRSGKGERMERMERMRNACWRARPCADCSLCHKNWKMKMKTTEQGCYMLRDEIWKLGSEVKFGIALCESCFEKRIGRSLVYEDYSSAPVNWNN